MFITVPQYVQTPTSVGYGFGASVTQSGLYLLPFALAMVVVAPFTGWLSLRIGSKVVLILGSLISAASYVVLVIGHSQSWAIYLSAGLLGLGLAPAFASLANLIIENVPADQTGVATGMNTNVRTHRAGAGGRHRHQPGRQPVAARRLPQGVGLCAGLRRERPRPARGRAGRLPHPHARRRVGGAGRVPPRPHRRGRGHRGRHRLRARVAA